MSDERVSYHSMVQRNGLGGMVIVAKVDAMVLVFMSTVHPAPFDVLFLTVSSFHTTILIPTFDGTNNFKI